MTLHCLPIDVLNHLAHVLAMGTRDEHAALMELALAAPIFHAPCMRAAIRTTTASFISTSTVWFDRQEQDQVHLSASSVKTFVRAAKQLKSDQWYLVLVLRGGNRAPVLQPQHLSTHDQDWPVRAFRRWSLLPVPFRQICNFYMYFNDRGRGEDRDEDEDEDEYSSLQTQTIPPFCRHLALSGRVPWEALRLPSSLVQLDLWRDVVLPDSRLARNVFTRLPRTLRALKIHTLVRARSDESALAVLLDHVPKKTVRFLDVALGPDKPLALTVGALARLIARSPGLTRLSIDGCDRLSSWDPTVLSLLPRKGMRDLKLLFAYGMMPSGDDVIALAQIAAGLPTTVESFTWSMAQSWRRGQLNDTTVLHPIVAHFPLATRSLSLEFPTWDAVMGASLPLTLPLQSLHLEFAPRSEKTSDFLAGLVAVVSRIPATVVDLTLQEWPIGSGTLVLPALAQHLPPRIVSLTLGHCRLTSADLEQFTWPSTLRRLDLGGNGLTVGPARLPSRLQELDLNATFLSDGDCEWIAGLPLSLERLVLSGNRVGDNVAGALCKYAQKGGALAKLELSDTAMSQKAVADLSKVVAVVVAYRV
ncbi:hypothetical protein AMAG_12125 [Allomyces macrogynus ATCC 38327]|uniref:F-box domain-containing protein n=1 Tax=Allomyces macrogynus (strain ATCC 38327) TaxID=578462 RepID=A0A0L0SX22_ALLM3|nr:hypothetical protein AMAG_12125 [Allomyces macrogynus ATCC 38327]|eukprot:KNE67047.1 hypothetical protein AMAG_12125 [Allomyces macrogynus ATCC 38327]